MRKLIPILILLLAGCSTHSPADKSTLRVQHILKPNDTIWLLNAKSVERHSDNRMVVDQQGNLHLPLVGLVHVAGNTTQEAEHMIEDAYIREGFYKELDITIELENPELKVQQSGPGYPPQSVGSPDP